MRFKAVIAIVLMILGVSVFKDGLSAWAKNDAVLHHTKQVVFSDKKDASRSLAWLQRRNDTDIAAHLILAMRYSALPKREIVKTLSQITNFNKAEDWFGWMLWLERNNALETHHSYIKLKEQLLLSIDSKFSRFINETSSFDIRLEEIVWGGVKVDGIPALDKPEFIPADQQNYLQANDEVFGIEINGDVRAYPLRILGWHEMFNDVIGDVPVTMAYCTLCGAGILFETTATIDGATPPEPLTFGSSGLLYHSNKLMYDRQTNSLWNQLTAEPISGPLKDKDINFRMLPMVIEKWESWHARHPETKVLNINTGYKRNYGAGVVYKEYFESPDLMFPTLGGQSLKTGRNLNEKDQIFGLRMKGGIKAWPISLLVKQAVLNDKVGQTNVALISEEGSRSIRAYERREFQFVTATETTDGQIWRLTEDALISDTGQRLSRLPGHISYWFAWAGYFGDESALYTE